GCAPAPPAASTPAPIVRARMSDRTRRRSAALLARLGAGLDVRNLREVAVYARDALDLALGGEALVEAFRAEIAHVILPRGEALLPAVDAALGWVGVGAREVCAHPHHRLERDRLGHHVAVVAPRITPHALAGLEEIAH